jgi:predicted nucleic acid-binding protein
MVEQLVVDASVLVASFLVDEPNHWDALSYVSGLTNGDCHFHLPQLAVVETLAAINRRVPVHQEAYVWAVRTSFEEWLAQEKLTLYDLNTARAGHAVAIALRDRLRGSDAVYAALADELGFPLKSYDTEHLRRFQGNASP